MSIILPSKTYTYLLDKPLFDVIHYRTYLFILSTFMNEYTALLTHPFVLLRCNLDKMKTDINLFEFYWVCLSLWYIL